MVWARYLKEGVDPRHGQPSQAERQLLKVDSELSMKKAYEGYLRGVLSASGAAQE